MANQLLSIQEAADLSNKSVQTIRRLIKGGKVKYRRKRTSQGFNYQIDKASLLEELGAEKLVAEPVNEPVAVKPEPIKYEAPVREPQPIGVPRSETVINTDFSHAKSVREHVYQKPAYQVDSEPQIYILDSQTEEILTSQQVDSTPVETPTQTQTESTNQTAVGIGSAIVEKLLDQHREDKEKLYQLLEIFQNRVVSLEEQIKLLQAPKKKWWQMW